MFERAPLKPREDEQQAEAGSVREMLERNPSELRHAEQQSDTRSVGQPRAVEPATLLDVDQRDEIWKPYSMRAARPDARTLFSYMLINLLSSTMSRDTGFPKSGDMYSFLENAKELAASEDRGNPFRRQGRRLTLPVKLRGKTVLALPDTGSDIDAISMDLVKELNLKFSPCYGSKKTVRLSDGHTMAAIGKVSTRVLFAKGAQLKLRRTFYVFPKISTDVKLIFGRAFLDHTQTWTKHQERLQERETELQSIPKVMNMSVPRRRLKCYIDSRLVLATADTGSEVDLINESYALSRGFNIVPVSEEESFIQLPGQRVATITGKVKVKFDTFHDAPYAPNSLEKASSNNKAPSSVEVKNVIGQANSPAYISDDHRTLYVLPSLTSNVLLGEELLDSIDAFGAHLDSFVDFENLSGDVSDVNSIKWLNSLERKFLNKRSATSTWPPSTLDIHSSHSPAPNLDSIEDFFEEPLETLNLHSDHHYLAAMSTRHAQESSRRRRMITHLKGLTAKEQASIDPNEKLLLVAAIQDLESRERQAEENYARDKQRCKDAWASWKAWLEASRRNQP